MTTDQQAIRNLVSLWLAASKTNDLHTLLPLMSDDVIFQTVGRPPFGKKEFIAQSNARPPNTQLHTESNILELQVLNNFAFLRNHLRITITPPNANPLTLSGHTLTLLQKSPTGHWQITRDANLLIPEK